MGCSSAVARSVINNSLLCSTPTPLLLLSLLPRLLLVSLQHQAALRQGPVGGSQSFTGERVYDRCSHGGN